MVTPIILASASPRRKDLLASTGLPFRVVVKDTEESFDSDLSPAALCMHNAYAKARAVAEDYSQATVIGADTLVFLDGKPLGKPIDEADAFRMLSELSGKSHFVCTGVAICSPLGDEIFAVNTEVRFNILSPEMIRAYMNLVHVNDKAGAYAFQEHGDMIIAEVNGDTDNVIGLPVNELLRRLRNMGH
jgi:septum formation protein